MTMMDRRHLIALAMLAAAGAANAKAAPNAQAPDFTLRQLNGPNLRLSKPLGRVDLVNFWATWSRTWRVALTHLSLAQGAEFVEAPFSSVAAVRRSW